MRLNDREWTRDPAQDARERLAFAHEPDCTDFVTTVQDVELGYRAADGLYLLEDADDILYLYTNQGDEQMLICPKCAKEIEPGSKVSLIFDGDEPPRIATEDDMIVVHEECADAGEEQG